MSFSVCNVFNKDVFYFNNQVCVDYIKVIYINYKIFYSQEKYWVGTKVENIFQ